MPHDVMISRGSRKLWFSVTAMSGYWSGICVCENLTFELTKQAARGILADIGAELGGILHAIFNLNVNR